MTKQTGRLLVLVLVSMMLSASVSAFYSIPVADSATQEVGRSGLIVEIYSDGELFTKHTLLAPTPDRLSYSYSIFRVPKGRVAKTKEGNKVFAFQLLPSLRGDTARIEVLALLEDPDRVSETNPMDMIKKRPVASHIARAGEMIKVSEMSQFGVRPLEIKVSSVEAKGKNSQ